MEFLLNTNSPEGRAKLLAKLDELNEQYKGKQVTLLVNLKRNKPVRSTDQNARYWAILSTIGAQIGETKEALHFSYAVMFIPEDHEVNGIRVPRKTSELKTDEFTIYMNQVEMHAKEWHGVKIPHLADNTYSMWERQTRNHYDAMFASIDVDALPE